MDSILVAACAGVLVDKKVDIAPKVMAQPGRYSIGNSELCLEWRWIQPGWGLASRSDYSRWDDDGPLYKKEGQHPALHQYYDNARRLIIDHFGLDKIADSLSLEQVAQTSPAAFFAMRRRLETECGLECKNDMISDRGGDHCSAEFCA